MVLHRKPNRQEILQDPSVRNLAKQILRLTEGRDPVDCRQDLLLALGVLEEESMNAIKDTREAK